MQNSLPFLFGQIEYLEKNLQLIKKAVSDMSKKDSLKKRLYGSLPRTSLSFVDFQKLRKTLSSSWEQEWK